MRLLELREEKKLSQFDVADAINTSRTNIGRWESGKNEPTSSSLWALADFFECSVDYLLGREDDFGNVSVQGSGPALTHAEQQLLNDFRELSPDLQEMLQATIQTWKKASANSKRA